MKGWFIIMSKVAVVYWSGTGNTEAMAAAVADGAREKGADVEMLTASAFGADKMDGYDAIAFGCPAMGQKNWRKANSLRCFPPVKPSSTERK